MTIANLPPFDLSLTDAIRQMLDAESCYIPERNFGKGATVPESYMQAKARRLFLHALRKLVPNATFDLLNDAPPTNILDFIERQLAVKVVNAEEQREAAPDGVGEQILEDARHIADALHAHISKWQRRYRLHDPWIARAALFTLKMTNENDDDGDIYDGPLLLDPADAHLSAHDGPGEALAVSLDGEAFGLGTFDPRIETVDAAVKRLLPDLESRLRRALDSIAEEDRAVYGTRLPVTFRKATAFEWLVRYQALGESQAAISRADDIDRGHVSRQVNLTAALVGLTLRESTGGRPRRRHAATKRVR